MEAKPIGAGAGHASGVPVPITRAAPESAAERALQRMAASHPHLARHVDEHVKLAGRVPSFVATVPRSMKSEPVVDIIYPVGEPLFIHVHDTPEGRAYRAVEPTLDELERAAYLRVRELMLEIAPLDEVPEDPKALRGHVEALTDKCVKVVNIAETAASKESMLKQWARIVAGGAERVPLTQAQLSRVRYFLTRDIVDSGPLEPILRDSYIEDVHSIGTNPLSVVHKVFDMLETNVRFRDERELDLFLRTMSERIGRPVSDSRPIVDATLPDGSRVNIVYSTDVSQRGSSFTIRKFSEIPPSITQVIQWGAMSSQIAAYLWLCLENNMSVFVCGETASGKTTTLNAMLPFIQPRSKVFTAEDTPEVRPPHKTWQQLVTRESGPEEGRVEMFTLLKAALRSRPNYIIVGEIRGAEGAVAFQAMQTGHPCIATFHASSVGKMIQRFSAAPINVPVTFMDNLNVCLIQMAVHNKGRTLRRVLAVEEIEGYSEYAKGVLTRGVFRWEPTNDKQLFRGRNNSYILENKIATTIGYSDKRRIYDDLDLRARILDTMIAEGIVDYYDVLRVVNAFQEHGLEGLPFRVAGT